MKAFIKNLTNSTITEYIHDKSGEMPNTDIRPAVLVFPGGGYMMCSDREADPVALAYLAEGYNAFILRYTVGIDEPVSKSFADADEAMAYLHSNAGELNIDKDKIAVVGFSAGGHLAAWLSNHGKIKPQAAVLGYPAILAESGKMLRKEFPELCEKVSKNTPPTFIFTTRNDTVVAADHSLQYAMVLNKAKVGYELHIFSDGLHGLSMARTFTSSGNAKMVNDDVAQWFGLSVRWLKSILGDFAVSDGAGYNGPLNSHAPISLIMENTDIWKVVTGFLPAAAAMVKQSEESGGSDALTGASLRQIAPFSDNAFTEEQLDMLDNKLRKEV